MGIIERQDISPICRQDNTRRVDLCYTTINVVVIHTQHLVAACGIYAPDIMRIRRQGGRSRTGVIPVLRNRISIHLIEVLAPRYSDRISTCLKGNTCALAIGIFTTEFAEIEYICCLLGQITEDQRVDIHRSHVCAFRFSHRIRQASIYPGIIVILIIPYCQCARCADI